MKKISLPHKNKYGCYEIRLESIGGLGANLAGKILGEAGCMLDLDSASFSSYGSEKRGSPVKAYIRYSEKNIRINTPVTNPDILAVFHENLLLRENTLAGTNPHTSIIVNTKKTPDELICDMRLRDMPKGTVYTIDALKIAHETKSRINTVMLGTVAAASGFIGEDILSEIIKNTIGEKYPSLLAGNLAGIHRGFTEYASKEYDTPNRQDGESFHLSSGWGYKNAPIGGINPLYGSMISNDLSAGREGYVPIFLQEKCINCGLCDSTCPDMVFRFVPGEYKGKKTMVNEGLDYIHCKGCLRCVDVCPTKALIKGDDSGDINSVMNRELIRKIPGYTASGANSYITSESNTGNDRTEVSYNGKAKDFI